jgi:solute carrier family 26 (sodium-independent sulfate anion transporter), member 11
MPSTSVKTGHFLARALGIKLNNGDEPPDDLTRGESVFSVQTADSFIESPPTSAEWVQDVLPSGHELLEYARSLFPFTYWIGRYNVQWLLGDVVAGECAFLQVCGAVLTVVSRHYYWCCRRPSGDGLC